MAKYKLSYFDFPARRGEECRLAFHIAGVEFEDDRIPPSSWPERKPSTPWGSLPVLEVEGLGTLAQSNAILGYIGRCHGLHPSDPWQAARHEELMGAVEELRGQVTPTLRIKDPDQKRAAREQLAADFLPRWGANVERQLGEGPFVAGAKIHVVDLKLYMAARWFSSGGLDHVPSTVFTDCPKLLALERAVAGHERVAEWNARYRK